MNRNQGMKIRTASKCPKCGFLVLKTDKVCLKCVEDAQRKPSSEPSNAFPSSSGEQDAKTLYAQPTKHAPPKTTAKVAVLLASLGFCAVIASSLIGGCVQRWHHGAERLCNYNLKQIGLAMHNYHAVHGSFPPAYVSDEDEKPLYSWRVLLLPFLGHRELYDQFDKQRAWDSPENLAVSRTLIPIYQCPSAPRSVGTDYVVVVGQETLFPGAESMTIDDVQDGTSKTLMLLEIRNSDIHWAEPRDITLDDLLTDGLSGRDEFGGTYHPSGRNVVMADGSDYFVAEKVEGDALRALLTRDGGEAVSLSKVKHERVSSNRLLDVRIDH